MITINFDDDTFKFLVNNSHICNDINRKNIAKHLIRIYSHPQIKNDNLGMLLMEKLPPRYLMEILSTITSQLFISCINPNDRKKFIEELYTWLTSEDIANAKDE